MLILEFLENIKKYSKIEEIVFCLTFYGGFSKMLCSTIAYLKRFNFVSEIFEFNIKCYLPIISYLLKKSYEFWVPISIYTVSNFWIKFNIEVYGVIYTFSI